MLQTDRTLRRLAALLVAALATIASAADGGTRQPTNGDFASSLVGAVGDGSPPVLAHISAAPLRVRPNHWLAAATVSSGDGQAVVAGLFEATSSGVRMIAKSAPFSGPDEEPVPPWVGFDIESVKVSSDALQLSASEPGLRIAVRRTRAGRGWSESYEGLYVLRQVDAALQPVAMIVTEQVREVVGEEDVETDASGCASRGPAEKNYWRVETMKTQRDGFFDLRRWCDPKRSAWCPQDDRGPGNSVNDVERFRWRGPQYVSDRQLAAEALAKRLEKQVGEPSTHANGYVSLERLVLQSLPTRPRTPPFPRFLGATLTSDGIVVAVFVEVNESFEVKSLGHAQLPLNGVSFSPHSVSLTPVEYPIRAGEQVIAICASGNAGQSRAVDTLLLFREQSGTLKHVLAATVTERADSGAAVYRDVEVTKKRTRGFFDIALTSGKGRTRKVDVLRWNGTAYE